MSSSAGGQGAYRESLQGRALGTLDELARELAAYDPTPAEVGRYRAAEMQRVVASEGADQTTVSGAPELHSPQAVSGAATATTGDAASDEQQRRLLSDLLANLTQQQAASAHATGPPAPPAQLPSHPFSVIVEHRGPSFLPPPTARSPAEHTGSIPAPTADRTATRPVSAETHRQGGGASVDVDRPGKGIKLDTGETPQSIEAQRQTEQRDADAKEAAFLRDTVHRLNIVLAGYQTRWGVLDAEGLEAPVTPRPWLVDEEHLAPLLTHYDAALAQLLAKVEFYQDVTSRLSVRSEELAEENSKLYGEMEKFLLAQRQRSGNSAPVLADDGRPDVVHLTSSEYEERQQRLELLAAELATVQQQNSLLTAQVSVLRRDRDAESRTRRETAEQLSEAQAELEGATQVIGTLEATAARMQQRRTLLRQTIAKLEDENDLLSRDLRDERARAAKLSAALDDREEKMATAREVHDRQALETSTQAIELKDLERRLAENEAQREAQRKSLKAMEDKVLATTQRDHELGALEREREAAAAEARAEKEALQNRCENQRVEIESLQERVQTLASSRQVQIDAEVERATAAVLDGKRALEEELAAVHHRLVNAESQRDRMERRWRAVQSEVEGMAAASKSDHDRMQKVVMSAREQLAEAERAKHNAEIEAGTLRVSAAEAERLLGEQRKSSSADSEKSRSRRRALEHELAMAREQLHKARAPSPAEEELNRQLDFAKDRLERSEHQRRLAENKLAETEQALVEGQAGADRAVGELHALVAAAQANSKRWKQEALDLAQQLASALSSVSAQERQLGRAAGERAVLEHNLLAAVSAH